MDLAAPTPSSAPTAEGSTMDLTQILEATLSPDTQQVMQSQKQLEYAAGNNLPVFLSALAAQLANVSNSQVSRMAAGLQLKNYLTSKDPAGKLVKQQQWLQFDATIKQQIKHLVVSTLGTEGQQYKSAAQCVAYVAAVELQMNTWPELIPLLLRNVASPESTEQVKEASLEAVGYVCEDLDPKFLAHQSNEILTAIVQGMRKEEPSNNVRLAATKALLNSLEFTKANFEKENERHFIMQVLCEATQCNCVPIQVAALQNMVRIMSLYYQYMESYMGPALFAITLEAMKSSIDDVALQGIEFWSTVCDEEVDLAIEAAEAEDSGHPPAQTSRFYVKGAMEYLVPILLQTLTKQEDCDDEDEWNPCKAAGVCLSLMSGCCEDAILTVVLPFVMQNIVSQDWKCRDAAVMALGSVLEGAQGDDVEKKIEPLVEPLIQLMSDDMVQVRDSVAWSIGRVCEHCPKALLQEKNLISLLQAFMVALAGELRVAVNVCWAFSTLVEAAYDMSVMGTEDDIPQTFCLSSLYQNIISKLIETGERSDAGSSNLRNAAYEAIMDMIKFSPKDVYEVVQQTALLMLGKLSEGIHMCCNPGVTGASRQQLMDAMSLLLATMQSLLRRLISSDVAKMSDQVMEKLLQVSMSGDLQEDVMMTVSVLVDVLGESFLKYMDAFFPVLLRGIADVANIQVCLASVGLVGDLCRSLSLQLLPLCDQLMTVLFSNLQNSDAHRSIKPPILCALGDIALAIGLKFACYLEVVLNILSQAAQFNVQGSDYDMLEYSNELRDSCLDAYTGIVQALKDSSADNKESHNIMFALMSQQLPFLVSYIVSVAVDEDKSDTNLGNALGLLGDLCFVFGTQLNLSVKEIQEILCKLVTQGRKSRTKRTRLVAEWASKELMSILQPRPPDTSAK